MTPLVREKVHSSDSEHVWFWHSNSSGMTWHDDMMWGIVLGWLSCGEWIICEWMSTLYIDKSDSVEWIYPGFQWSPRWHHQFWFGDPCEASQPSWSDPVGDDPQHGSVLFPAPSVRTSLRFERSPCMWTVRYEQSRRPHRGNWWMEGKQWQLNSTVMFFLEESGEDMWGLLCFFENNSILFVHTGCNLSFISSVSACDSVSFLGPSVPKSAGLIFFPHCRDLWVVEVVPVIFCSLWVCWEIQ